MTPPATCDTLLKPGSTFSRGRALHREAELLTAETARLSVFVCTHIFTLQSPANSLAEKVQWLIMCLDSLHLTLFMFAMKRSSLFVNGEESAVEQAVVWDILRHIFHHLLLTLTSHRLLWCRVSVQMWTEHTQVYCSKRNCLLSKLLFL